MKTPSDDERDVSRKTVLIVNDQEAFLCGISQGLSDYCRRFSIVTAANEEEALEVLRNTRVDLVVTDLEMQAMDGFGFLSRLRSERQELPIIVMSAYIDREAEQRLSALGVSRYISKPVNFEQLAWTFSESLGNAE